MRLLLDEQLPLDFAAALTGLQASHVHDLGWAGVKNGELLRRARDVCDVFLTLDQNLQFQQNLRVLPFGIVVVRVATNRMVDLMPYVADILAAADRIKAGEVVTVGRS